MFAVGVRAAGCEHDDKKDEPLALPDRTNVVRDVWRVSRVVSTMRQYETRRVLAPLFAWVAFPGDPRSKLHPAPLGSGRGPSPS